MHIITQEPIDFSEYYEEILKKNAGIIGGIVSFVGIVRQTNRGKKVKGINYEYYSELSENFLNQLEKEIIEKYSLKDLLIAHRIGWVGVGEVSLIVICASEHRDEAFRACREVVEKIKEKLPIWKKEVYEDGEEWI